MNHAVVGPQLQALAESRGGFRGRIGDRGRGPALLVWLPRKMSSALSRLDWTVASWMSGPEETGWNLNSAMAVGPALQPAWIGVPASTTCWASDSTRASLSLSRLVAVKIAKPRRRTQGSGCLIHRAAQNLGDLCQRENPLTVFAGQDVLYGGGGLVVLGCDGVSGVDDADAVSEGVGGGLRDAVVGRHAGEYDRVGVPVAQAEQQVGSEEGAVPGLEELR